MANNNTANKAENKELENVEKEKVNTANKAEKMKKVRIPLDQLNPKDTEVIVGINEKYAKVERGKEVEVSIPVYEVLKNAGLV